MDKDGDRIRQLISEPNIFEQYGDEVLRQPPLGDEPERRRPVYYRGRRAVMTEGDKPMRSPPSRYLRKRVSPSET